MDIHDFGRQSSIIHTSVDIHIDFQARISMQGHSAMDIRKQLISMDIHAFMDIRLQLSMLYGHQYVQYILGFPWISMH